MVKEALRLLQAAIGEMEQRMEAGAQPTTEDIAQMQAMQGKMVALTAKLNQLEEAKHRANGTESPGENRL